MRSFAEILPRSGGRNVVTSFLVFAVTLVAAYEAADYILVGDTMGLAYIGVAFIVAALVVAMLNRWRRGLYVFLIWLLFEDFVRKYLGNNMAIYFAKDVLALIVYLAFFLAWRRKETTLFRPPFLVPLLLMVWFGVIQIFNPESPHLVYGLLGFKMFFYYVPLILVSYSLIDSEEELRRFFQWNLLAILLITGLGIAQSIIGPSFLNPSTLQDDIRDLSTLYRVAPISGTIVYRPTSVFVSTGRYSDLLNVAYLLVFGYLGYTLLLYPKGRRLALVSISAVTAAIILSASRGSFLWGLINLVVSVFAFLWGAPWKQQQVIRVLRTIFRASLGLTLAVVILLVAFPEAILGRLAVYSETLSPDSPASELVHRARDYPLQNMMGAFNDDRWPYGYGIGTTANGIQYVARIIGVKPLGVGVESGFGVLVVEMGIGGLVLWIVMSVAIVVSALKVVVKLRGSPWFPIAFVIFWFTFIMLFPAFVGGIQAYEDFVLNAYFWLLLGILFRLPQIKISTELGAAQLASATPRRRWIF